MARKVWLAVKKSRRCTGCLLGLEKAPFPTIQLPVWSSPPPGTEQVKHLGCVNWQLHLTEDGVSRGMRAGNITEVGVLGVMTLGAVEVTQYHHGRVMSGKENEVGIQGKGSLRLPKRFHAEAKGKVRTGFHGALSLLKERA